MQPASRPPVAFSVVAIVATLIGLVGAVLALATDEKWPLLIAIVGLGVVLVCLMVFMVRRASGRWL